MARTFVVVENRKHWDLRIPQTEVITADEYLTEPRFADVRRARVFNLCRTKHYQGSGYYVSLLATARAHRVLPTVNTMQDLRENSLIDLADQELDGLIQRSLAPLKSEKFELSIYFGRNLASRYDRLSAALFARFPTPMLRAEFVRSRRWRLDRLRQISTRDVPADHHDFVSTRAEKYFSRRRPPSPAQARYDLAILIDPNAADAPSDQRAISRFIDAAREVKMAAYVVQKNDFNQLAEFDGLFIRETTAVNHHTYRFSTRAEAEGMIVMDDPTSIIRCSNKVYLADLFTRHKIPCPPTMIVHRGNRQTIAEKLGLPCVLKRPDSAFSTGVVRVTTTEELDKHLDEFLVASDLVIAQGYTPTTFDWRIGVLDRKALFACKYFMATGHWQIRSGGAGRPARYGRVETFSLADVPAKAVELAERSTALIGNGLYGVDIKQMGDDFLVVEINDNPNIEAGVEDAILKDQLYLQVMQTFFSRLEGRGRSQGA